MIFSSMNEAKLIKLQTNKLINGMEMLDLSVENASIIMDYLVLLQKWNKTYNLTAIDQIDEMVTHHALDALAVIKYFNGQRVIDVGTGAGIPGFLIAIMCPEKKVYLLDSVGKKARFMRQVKRELQLGNVEVIHSRVENYFPDEKFDVVTSRAFTELGRFLTVTDHLLKPDGDFLAMKGPRPEPLDKGQPYEEIACFNVEVPFMKDKRKLYQFRRLTK